MEAKCEAPQSANKCARRHCNSTSCRVLHHVCIFNETLFHLPSPARGWQVAQMTIRVPWNSHHLISYEELAHGTNVSEGVRSLLDSAPITESACSPPLAWVPVWIINYADTFYSTIVPLLELERMGLLRANHTLLIPDTLNKHIHRKCRSVTNGPCQPPHWFAHLTSHISKLRFMHQLAAGCASNARADNCAPPMCFTHLRFCSLRSMFDRQPAGLDIWATAQAFARRVLPNDAIADGGANADSTAADGRAAKQSGRIVRVLIERRVAKGMHGRALSNVDELLQMCAAHENVHDDYHDDPRGISGPRQHSRRAEVLPPVSLPLRLQCKAHTFGTLGLAADVKLARWADVLVGMHGAGLTNAFFMKRRSTLVEVRPYGTPRSRDRTRGEQLRTCSAFASHSVGGRVVCSADCNLRRQGS